MKTLQEMYEWNKDRPKLLKELADGFVQMMDEKGWFKTCLNCSYWNGEPNEICNKYKARPPARIIIAGCESHTDDIPF